MSDRTRYRCSPAARLWRWLRAGRNPLRRRSDRIEAAALTAVLLGALLAVGLSVWAGAQRYDAQRHLSAVQAASRHQVTAVLLRDAPSTHAVQLAAPATTTTLARWPGPGGAARTGNLRVLAGSPAGTHIAIWVDAAGRQVRPPTSQAEAVGTGIVVGLFGALITTGTLAAGFLLLRRRLDRTRLSAWDSEWARIDPRTRR
jgi:hypothetical protein